MKKLEQWIGLSGPYIVIFLTIIPIALWFPYSSWDSTISITRSIGQITALTGTVLLCMEFILAARWTAVEYMFMGLNRVYIFHHLIGAGAFILLLIHPLFLILSYLGISLAAAFDLVWPTMDNIPVLTGITALAYMTLLLILTLFVNLEYDTWKKTHIWIGGALFLGSIHALLIGSTISQSYPLKFYMVSLMTAGMVSYAYRVFRKYMRPKTYGYSVTDIRVIAGSSLITLLPRSHPMPFVPGQFAFFQFFHKGILPESHPFSIANAPNNGILEIAAKSTGDYTETLKLLEKDTQVSVEGPYGRFSYTYINNLRFIWIAGGIGVTPFVSMLTSLLPNHALSVDFIYSVKDESEALYLSLIRETAARIPNVRFTLWESSRSGRFTASSLPHGIPDALTATFMICGPPAMMKTVKSDLVKLGVRKRNILSEEFALQ